MSTYSVENSYGNSLIAEMYYSYLEHYHNKPVSMQDLKNGYKRILISKNKQNLYEMYINNKKSRS